MMRISFLVLLALGNVLLAAEPPDHSLTNGSELVDERAMLDEAFKDVPRLIDPKAQKQKEGEREFARWIAYAHRSDVSTSDRVYAVQQAMKIVVISSASKAVAMTEALALGSGNDRVMMLAAAYYLGPDSHLVHGAVRAVVERHMLGKDFPVGGLPAILLSLLKAYPGDVYFSDLFVGYVRGIMPADIGVVGRREFLKAYRPADVIEALCQGIEVAGRDDPALRRFLAWQCSHPRASIRWLAATSLVTLRWPVAYEDGPRLIELEKMLLCLGPERDDQRVRFPMWEKNAVVPLWDLVPGSERDVTWWRQQTVADQLGLALVAGWRALPHLGGPDLTVIESTLLANTLLEDDFVATSVLVGLWHYRGDLEAAVSMAAKALNVKGGGGNGVRRLVYQWMAMPHMKRYRPLIVRDVVQSLSGELANMPVYTVLDGMYLLGLLGNEASLARPLMTRLATPGSKELRNLSKEDVMMLRYGALWTLPRIGIKDDMIPVVSDDIRHSDDVMLATAAAVAAGALGANGTACMAPLRDRLTLMLDDEQSLYNAISINHPASHLAVQEVDYTSLELEIVRAIGLIGGPEGRTALPQIDRLSAKIAARDDGRMSPPRAIQERIIFECKTALGSP